MSVPSSLRLKNGLESEGLTGLGDEVMGASDSQQGSEQQEVQKRTVQRRGAIPRSAYLSADGAA